MTVIGAKVLQRKYHADVVWLTVTLPSPHLGDDDALTVEFDCPKGSALMYLKKHLPWVAVQVIDERRG